mmetsp:Transcript_32466/g.67814  ORF Transcript_32466/g.67814 Transcript_32466/m.67814 type:complete len:333 (+) Transcript_32466:551-1549(+)
MVEVLLAQALEPEGLRLLLLVVVGRGPDEIGVQGGAEQGEVDDEADDAAKEHHVAHEREHDEHERRPAAGARPAEADNEERRGEGEEERPGEDEGDAQQPGREGERGEDDADDVAEREPGAEHADEEDDAADGRDVRARGEVLVVGLLELGVLGVVADEDVDRDQPVALVLLAEDGHSLDLGVEEEDEAEPGANGADDGPEEGVGDVALGGRLVHVEEDGAELLAGRNGVGEGLRVGVAVGREGARARHRGGEGALFGGWDFAVGSDGEDSLLMVVAIQVEVQLGFVSPRKNIFEGASSSGGSIASRILSSDEGERDDQAQRDKTGRVHDPA